MTRFTSLIAVLVSSGALVASARAAEPDVPAPLPSPTAAPAAPQPVVTDAATAAPAAPQPVVTDAASIATTAPVRETSRPVFTVALKVGGMFPQPFSNLGAAAAYQLELGTLLWQRRLAVFAGAGYAQPSTSGTVSDGRVDTGQASWQVTVRQLDVTVGAALRFPLRRLTPYAGVAFRMQMQKAISTGSVSTAALGENGQTATVLGGVLLAGAELALGPGGALAELQAGYAGIDRAITGSSNTGSLGLLIGYRVAF